MGFFLPRPEHLTKTSLIIIIYTPHPPFWLFFCISCYAWWFLFFAPRVVADVCVFFLIWGLFLLHILVIHSVFFVHFVTHTRRPILTHPLCKGFSLTRIASHWNVGGWSVALVEQRSEIPPAKKVTSLVTQPRALICGLLIFFMTQSGSCTLQPSRLLCCFPSHWRQISSNITSSSLSSTATKTQNF